jgi:phage tail-like protein
MLPALYQEDDFTVRFASAFDAVLAPVLCTLDNLTAYFDPELTPTDFLEWLAGWVRVSLRDGWSIDRQRRLVSRAVDLFRWRGTVRGLRHLVAAYTGTQPEIDESGAVAASGVPGGEIPGSPSPILKVRVCLDSSNRWEVRQLDALIASLKPAHVPHVLEVVSP